MFHVGVHLKNTVVQDIFFLHLLSSVELLILETEWVIVRWATAWTQRTKKNSQFWQLFKLFVAL